jgi:hypothetical protein
MSKPTATIPRRRRWRIAEARSVLAALASSKLSLPEFAAQEGLEPQRLRRWRSRLAGEAHRPAPPPPVIELRPSPNLRPVEPIEIVLASGVVVRVSEAIDPAALARLVTALRGC